MKRIDKTPAKLFSRENAENLAAQLNADQDDDWTYKAEHDPKGTGYSKVAAYDEDGELAAYI